MTSTAEAKRVVQETIEQLGGIDIVVSNAVGARGRLGPVFVAERASE
jgi:NAD(P)-dependent dehydrogenase (short-subunit alcohol dehydrogenase family)